MSPCADCVALDQLAWPQAQRASFPHLREVYSSDRDELLDEHVHACQACQRLWRETHNSYGPAPEDYGWAWSPLALQRHLAQVARLPGAPPSEAAFWEWVAAEGEPLYEGRF